MATRSRRLTYEERNAVPQERPNDRHELIDGQLTVLTTPPTRHQGVASNLTHLLGLHVRAETAGEIIIGPIDICLTPHIVLIPDLIFICRDRLHIVGPRAIEAAPDLVVEILSPDTRERDLGVKRELYARFGVQEYWIADLDSRSLTVLALHGDCFKPVVSAKNGRVVSRLFPELELDLDQVFDLW